MPGNFWPGCARGHVQHFVGGQKRPLDDAAQMLDHLTGHSLANVERLLNGVAAKQAGDGAADQCIAAAVAFPGCGVISVRMKLSVMALGILVIQRAAILAALKNRSCCPGQTFDMIDFLEIIHDRGESILWLLFGSKRRLKYVTVNRPQFIMCNKRKVGDGEQSVHALADRVVIDRFSRIIDPQPGFSGLRIETVVQVTITIPPLCLTAVAMPTSLSNAALLRPRDAAMPVITRMSVCWLMSSMA